MSVSVRRSLVAVAAACALGLLALTFVMSDSVSNVPKPVVPPVGAQNVILVPSLDQTSNFTGISDCTWLKANTSDARPMSTDSLLLLASPLAAAEYAVNGMSGVHAVAVLYGC